MQEQTQEQFDSPAKIPSRPVQSNPCHSLTRLRFLGLLCLHLSEFRKVMYKTSPRKQNGDLAKRMRVAFRNRRPRDMFQLVNIICTNMFQICSTKPCPCISVGGPDPLSTNRLASSLLNFMGIWGHPLGLSVFRKTPLWALKGNQHESRSHVEGFPEKDIY